MTLQSGGGRMRRVYWLAQMTWLSSGPGKEIESGWRWFGIFCRLRRCSGFRQVRIFALLVSQELHVHFCF